MKYLIKASINWLADAKILSMPRRWAEKVANYVLERKYGALFYYSDPASIQALNLIRQIKVRKDHIETVLLLTDLEAYQIYAAVRKTEKIAGDVAEVGVYKGGSARLICETTKKPLHLFDTFEGLPDLCDMDNSEQFHKGDYSAQLESVKEYLKKYPNVYFYKGLFPATSEPVKNKKFSFIHLDVDIYESTVSCLQFFYPRMNKGGVIVSHDYQGSMGVKKAIDEFFKDKPEIIIEPSGCDQCLVVKV